MGALTSTRFNFEEKKGQAEKRWGKRRVVANWGGRLKK